MYISNGTGTTKTQQNEYHTLTTLDSTRNVPIVIHLTHVTLKVTINACMERDSNDKHPEPPLSNGHCIGHCDK